MRLGKLGAAAVLGSMLLVSGCATDSGSPSGGADTVDVADPTAFKPCEIGRDLDAISALQSQIAKADDRRAAINANSDALNALADKASRPKPDYGENAVLACRTVELLARGMLVELEPDAEQPEPLQKADLALKSAQQLCAAPGANKVQCAAVQDFFSTVLFARRATAQVEHYAPDVSGGDEVNFDAVETVVDSLTMNVSKDWPEALEAAAANETAPIDTTLAAHSGLRMTERLLRDEYSILTCRVVKAVSDLMISPEAQVRDLGSHTNPLIASMSQSLGLGDEAGCDARPTARSQNACHVAEVAKLCAP